MNPVIKRAFDCTASTVLLLLLAGPAAVVALTVLLVEGSPVFYGQQRVGRHGRPFTILKFRTMRPAAAGDAAITSGRTDDRITKTGAVLRRFRVDEWPQLWNVLRGDMSLVGPRPEAERFVDLSDPRWQVVLQVRPGITGPDALAFKDEGVRLAAAVDAEQCYRDEILPEKLALQMDYVRTRSLFKDVAVLFRTLGALMG